MISSHNVHVINLSCGKGNVNVYDRYSREINTLVRNNKVTIVVAAGNNGQTLNPLALAPNAIAVGAVISSGTNQAADGAYTLWDSSSYRESKSIVNKPDVCAPGYLEIFGYEDIGTSFAAPHVTGTVVQMMSRNVGLTNKPETLKAILMASASFNAGTSMSYVTGTRASNKEGAGVIDAGFCYQVASNGRRTHFDATSSPATFSHDIYCDTTTVPFRVACTWEVIMTDGEASYADEVEVFIPDFDMYIYKNGTFVTSSTADTYSTTNPTSNYEIIELSTSKLAELGAGYYQVQIVRNDNNNGGSFRVGLAWEQR